MNRNSALLWYPPILAAGLPVPRTVFVPYDHRRAAAEMEGGTPGEMWPLRCGVLAAAEEIGFPCFVRTDLTSAKHDGPSAYKLESRADIDRVIQATVADNEMKLWLEPEGPKAFMVREFLNLDAGFCAFGGLPIAREWRFFVRSRLRTRATATYIATGEGATWECICCHEYWPEEAIAFYNDCKEPEGWRAILAEHHQLDYGMTMALSQLAIEAGKACGGDYWSVDFAQDRAGKWWLLDMAHGDDSFHWPECANAPKGAGRV